MLDLTLEVGLPIHLEPRLYTTQAALRLQGRNAMTDAAAATLILDNYLVKNKKNNMEQITLTILLNYKLKLEPF